MTAALRIDVDQLTEVEVQQLVQVCRALGLIAEHAEGPWVDIFPAPDAPAPLSPALLAVLAPGRVQRRTSCSARLRER